jgi:methylenetetrahydrofolate dehydrogenase (NADP+)/methenyltetrahydrofolate cyclohydrolase
MNNTIIDGRTIAETINQELKKEILALKKNEGRNLKLVSLQVGENGGIESYLRSQKKAASKIGIELEIVKLDDSAGCSELLVKIKQLNEDDMTDAIILQRPLPEKIEAEEKTGGLAFEQRIRADKDAEGLHLENLGRLFYDGEGNKVSMNKIAPCTAQAVMEIIKSTGIKLYGKEATIIGHSKIIGKPLSLMLLNKYVTTTVCHIATKDIKTHVEAADILISAVGKPGLIKGSWVKEGALVIDVGTSRVGNHIKGDVEFEEARKRASYITPVPGGVGPLTTAMLMKNVIKLHRHNNNDKKNI